LGNLPHFFDGGGHVVLTEQGGSRHKGVRAGARQSSVPNLICATRRDWHSGLYPPSIAVQLQMNAD
jgi:hypothetical protein